MDIEATAPAPPVARRAARRIYRHRLPVRVMHWINVVCLTVLLMSGLKSSTPTRRSTGAASRPSRRPWISFGARNTPNGPVGYTRIGHRVHDHRRARPVELGDGARQLARAFPEWATIPGPQWLAMARRWHFFFAWLFVVNGVAYLLYTVFSRHLAKDLVPTRDELKNIGRSIVDHLKLKHPTGDAATRYNVLQSLTYLVVIFGLLPLVVITGLAMSPRLDTVFTGWVDLLGGRQSARTLHFLAAFGLLAFVVVHVAEVFIAGVWNEMRSMITGWYAIPEERSGKEAQR